MSSGIETVATINDLLQMEEKAELIRGRIVPIMPTGRRPNLVAGRIYRSLAGFTDRLGDGEAYTDNMGFAVRELSSGRQSFSPDVSFFRGTFPANPMRLIDGAPTFAVEVRSENDYGSAAEAEMAAKRADYFEGGTLVVWDVDQLTDVIRVYCPDRPDLADEFGRGQHVYAEPALPGWRVDVSWVFE